MTKTIEQQLKDFAANPVVDGVRWEVVGEPLTSLSGDSDYYFRAKMGRGIIIDISTAFRSGILWWMNCDTLRVKDQQMSLATTPADACREALRICREMVAELAGAFGVGENRKQQITDHDLLQKYNKWSAGIISDIGNGTCFAAGYRQAERDLLNQPTCTNE